MPVPERLPSASYGNNQTTTEHVSRTQSDVDQVSRSETASEPRFASRSDSTLDPLAASASEPSPSRSSFGLEQRACRRQQAFVLHEMLWDIFMQIYESRFSMFLGDSCCPYVGMNVSSKTFISRLSIQLDKLCAVNSNLKQQQLNDRLINDATNHAVYTYASRWLPLHTGRPRPPGPFHRGRPTRPEQELSDYLWRRTQSKIQSIMSRPSYRAIHAMQIFGAAERPLNCDDPGFADLCGQVQMSHILQLQASAGSPPSTRLSPYTTFLIPDHACDSPEVNNNRGSGDNQTRRRMEDAIFWLSVMKDSYSSLIRRGSPTLLPHVSGDKRLWDFIRQRTVIFNNAFQTLHGSPHALPNEVITIILQHASACKVMFLNVINRFYNVVNYHNVEDSVEEAAQKIIAESDRFHSVFDPLLAICARDFLTLEYRDQLNYVWLITHYHLGSLTLANIMEDAPTTPICLKNPVLSRLYACKAIVNALSLGLQADRHSLNPGSYPSRLLLEPVPEIQVEALSLACSAIFLLHRSKELSTANAKVMLSVISTALNILSQISITASFVMTSVHEQSSKHGINMSHEDSTMGQQVVANVDSRVNLSMLDRHSLDDFSQEMEVQIYNDNSMIDRMIHKYEDENGLQGPTDVDPQDESMYFMPGEATSTVSKSRFVFPPIMFDALERNLKVMGSDF
ncbi:hypothetical protein B0A52_10320 [Exophiala mesophila]|uniref:Transcription factor domain-containing protein n=1 Tax=Exophiala mesophila TaxID=212818 RepID=A0A438MQ93_EXOME|nr:hypothetical protein B0A52_10320 [Exophiala mesophila]